MGERMDLIRIGDKLIHVTKIDETVRQVLKMRSEGLSQQEVAAKLNLDRTFISRLETIGCIRKGGQIGLLAFPVANKDELVELIERYGIEQHLILNDRERWQLVEQRSGMDFFNQVMAIVERFRQCDTVIMFCSAKWNRLAEALLDSEVFTVEIGETPIQGDIHLEAQVVEEVLSRFIK